MPTLDPDSRPVGADTPVRVKIGVRTDSSEDLIGQVIGERYQIQRLIGYGGMGVVYQARHVVLDKLVAVKLLLTPQNTEYRRRFLQEAKLASQISHPNTVFLSDFGVLSDGRSYLVMELLRGTTVSQLLTHGRLEPLRACQIATQIARGLTAVHDQGVIHRDLKPENVFLLDSLGQDGSKDFVKIVDFGIAKRAGGGNLVHSGANLVHADANLAWPLITSSGSDLRRSFNTLPGTLLGTPGYMSPEQVSGAAVDFRVDQYSLGCILFEMLSGALPFEDTTVGGMLQKHLDEAPPSLRQRFPLLPISPALDQLVLRLLAKKPTERFPAMREVTEALDREIEQLLIERGDRSAPVKPLPTPSWRRPLWVALPLLAMLVGGLSWMRYSLFPPPEKLAKVGLLGEELAELRERAVTVLQDNLHAELPELRAAAVHALWQTRDPALRPQIEARLDDPSMAVEVEAADALGQLGLFEAEARLQTLIDHSEAHANALRVAAAGALLRLGSTAGQRSLEQSLADTDAATQLQAALLLCEDQQPTALPVLRTLLPQLPSQAETTAAALACLSRLGEASALRTLRERRAGSTPESLYAAAALWGLGDESSQEQLKALLARRGPLQLAAARRMAGPWAPAISDLVRRIALDPGADAIDRQLAAVALGAISDPREARSLSPLLAANIAGPLRQAAATAIICLAPADSATLTAQSLGWARSTLDAGTEVAQLSAARVLGDIPSPEAVVLLLSTLGERNVLLRRAAAQALGRRPERATLHVLLYALSDEDAGVRLSALRALSVFAARLQERGGAPKLSALNALLQRLQSSGTPLEQLLATSALFRLGNVRERDRLRTLATTASPELRAVVLAELPFDPPLLISALADPLARIQRLAAQRLAVLGDRRAVPVLRGQLHEGDAQALLAYGLLRRLGEKVDLPVTAEPALLAFSVEQRLDAVAAVRDFPPDVALPVVLRAARDVDPTVRREAAEVAGDLPRGARGPEGAAVLRTLLLDRDLTVWTLARALLARAGAGPGEPIEPTLTATTDRVTGARTFDPDDKEPGTSATGDGELIVEAPSGIFFQVDRRPWQTTPTTALRLPSGPHTVASLSESQEILVASGVPTTVKVHESPIEQFLQAGLLAVRHDDLRGAQRQLERARALCEHDRQHEVPCRTLGFLASYYLGTVFETEKEYGRAMTDFRRAETLAGQVKSHNELKLEIQGAVRRLATRVGEVQIGTMIGGRCRRTTFWLDPGTHRLEVGSGHSEMVAVRAGQTVDAGGCK